MTSTTSALTLERRTESDRTTTHGGVSLTPFVEEDYWAYRVRLTDSQAIVGFPKFGTIGIGFAVEDDWNSNLPYGRETAAIVRHICHNAGDEGITVARMCEAVDLIRRAAYEDHGGPGDHLVGKSGWEVGSVLPFDVTDAERKVAEKFAKIAAKEAEMAGEQA